MIKALFRLWMKIALKLRIASTVFISGFVFLLVGFKLLATSPSVTVTFSLSGAIGIVISIVSIVTIIAGIIGLIGYWVCWDEDN